MDNLSGIMAQEPLRITLRPKGYIGYPRDFAEFSLRWSDLYHKAAIMTSLIYNEPIMLPPIDIPYEDVTNNKKKKINKEAEEDLFSDIPDLLDIKNLEDSAPMHFGIHENIDTTIKVFKLENLHAREEMYKEVLRIYNTTKDEAIKDICTTLTYPKVIYTTEAICVDMKFFTDHNYHKAAELIGKAYP